MLQVSMEKPNVAFVIPEEGSTVTFDNFTVVRNSRNSKLAHEFINFMYRPEIAAENMNEIMYVTPHTEAVKLVDEKLRRNPAFAIPESVRSRCVPLRDLGEDNAKYIRAWDKSVKNEIKPFFRIGSLLFFPGEDILILYQPQESKYETPERKKTDFQRSRSDRALSPAFHSASTYQRRSGLSKGRAYSFLHALNHPVKPVRH